MQTNWSQSRALGHDLWSLLCVANLEGSEETANCAQTIRPWFQTAAAGTAIIELDSVLKVSPLNVCNTPRKTVLPHFCALFHFAHPCLLRKVRLSDSHRSCGISSVTCNTQQGAMFRRQAVTLYSTDPDKCAFLNLLTFLGCWFFLQSEMLGRCSDKVVSGRTVRGIMLRIPAGTTLFPPELPASPGVAPICIQWLEALSSGLKRPGREANHSRLSGADDTNERRCACARTRLRDLHSAFSC